MYCREECKQLLAQCHVDMEVIQYWLLGICVFSNNNCCIIYRNADTTPMVMINNILFCTSRAPLPWCIPAILTATYSAHTAGYSPGASWKSPLRSDRMHIIIITCAQEYRMSLRSRLQRRPLITLLSYASEEGWHTHQVWRGRYRVTSADEWSNPQTTWKT